MGEDRKICLDAGMHDYMSKPIRIEEIQEKIIHWFESRPRLSSAAITAGIAAELLEPQTIEMLRDLKKSESDGILGELVDIFRNQTPGLIDEIVSALEVRDALTLERAAHTLKGSSLNLGARGMADICQRVEYAAQVGDFGSANGTVTALQHCFERSLAALEQTLLGR
jgi:HPt (histidine-containing phosphotransfer) domain-containing protein